MEKVIYLPLRTNTGSDLDEYLVESNFISLLRYLDLAEKVASCPYNKIRIEKMRTRVRRMSDEKLFTHINRDHPGFWQVRTLFYDMVAEELKRRKLVKE
ncbi:MAG: hypothetical protein AAB906_04925 [Patescibacteria group bacterium]